MKYKLELNVEENPWGLRCRTCPLCIDGCYDVFCAATEELVSHGSCASEGVLVNAYACLEYKCPLEVVE